MHKVKFLLGLSLVTLICLATTVSAAPGPFTMGSAGAADAVVMSYDPATGNLSVAGNNVTMTSFQVESASGAFDPAGADAGFAIGPFDVATASKMFTLRTGGVTELNIGNVLAPGLSADALLADLTGDGSLSPNGTIDTAAGGGPYLNYVPEPSSILLSLCGLLGMLSLRRK